MRRAPALIVGGGPAGAAAAIGLCRAGVAPTLIERASQPRDVVCGGFLGWDALAALDRLGVDAAALGARRIESLRLVSGRIAVEARLPGRAAGLSRRTLDWALLQAAKAAGARVQPGRSARAIDARQLSLRLSDGEEMRADALLLASGKHEVRGAARDAEQLAPAVGLRTSLRPTPALRQALDGWIELHPFDGGYAGLLMQEDGNANLCISVSPEKLRDQGIDGFIKALAAEQPRLAERLDAGEPARWDAVAGVPYGWRAGRTAPGLFRLGDQAAVIASLAGDGIAIALESGLAAAEALASYGPQGAELFQRRLAARTKRPLLVAGGLRRAAEAPLARGFLMSVLRLAPALAPLAARFTRIGRLAG